MSLAHETAAANHRTKRKVSCEHNYINLRVSWMTYSYRDKLLTIFLAPKTEMLQCFTSQIFFVERFVIKICQKISLLNDVKIKAA